MTVAELIAILSKQNPNGKVDITGTYDNIGYIDVDGEPVVSGFDC